jgi:hypothetical protein
MNLTFVETLVFSARWDRRLGDGELRQLQNSLIEDPLRGDAIPGCGLLRKVRFADRSRGREDGAACVCFTCTRRKAGGSIW